MCLWKNNSFQHSIEHLAMTADRHACIINEANVIANCVVTALTVAIATSSPVSHNINVVIQNSCCIDLRNTLWPPIIIIIVYTLYKCIAC